MDGYTSPHGLSSQSVVHSFCRICSTIFHCKISSQWFFTAEEPWRKEEATDKLAGKLSLVQTVSNICFHPQPPMELEKKSLLQIHHSWPSKEKL